MNDNTIIRFTIIIFAFVFGSLIFTSCRESNKIKKIDITYSDQVDGTISKLVHHDDHTELEVESIGYDPVKITLSPSLQQLNIPEKLMVAIGDGIILKSIKTIGNESVAITFFKNNRKTLIYSQNQTSPFIFISVGRQFKYDEGYQVSIGDISPENINQPRVETTLMLTHNSTQGKVTAKVGESVNIDNNWTLMLLNSDAKNPSFSKDTGIAEESAELKFDYILYQK